MTTLMHSYPDQKNYGLFFIIENFKVIGFKRRKKFEIKPRKGPVIEKNQRLNSVNKERLSLFTFLNLRPFAQRVFKLNFD
jgi:hypothetical protein